MSLENEFFCCAQKPGYDVQTEKNKVEETTTIKTETEMAECK